MKLLSIAGLILLLAVAGRSDYPYNADVYRMSGSSPHEWIVGKWKPKGQPNVVIEFTRKAEIKIHLNGGMAMTGKYHFPRANELEVVMEFGGQKLPLKLEVKYDGREFSAREEKSNQGDQFERVR